MAYVREYRTRLVDQQLRRLLASVPAVSVNGARAVGKTRTAQAVAGSFFPLDDPTDWDQVEALDRHFSGVPTPVVLDEWQRMPRLWDRVRRAVDQDYTPGRFLLTGSSTPSQAPTHTGAGRIVTLRMRPFSLVERGLETAPTVSLAGLLASDAGQARQEDPTTPAAALPPVSGRTTVTIDQYVDEICRSGFPAIREQDAYAREELLEGYIEQTVTRDLRDAGGLSRRPRSVREWMTAYASAVATTTTFADISQLASRPLGRPLAADTARAYRDHLVGMWILDLVPGWSASENEFSRANLQGKHQLVDPALAARLLGQGPAEILGVRGARVVTPPGQRRRPRMLGPLFESLVTQSVQVYASLLGARVHHLRTKGGAHEVDLIVEGRDRCVVAIEVKAHPSPRPGDTRHLLWLRDRLGARLSEAVLVTTGRAAYRDRDGIVVVPAALLGP